MTRIVVKDLIWDSWNIEHIKKHKVTQFEVELVAKTIICHVRTNKGRYLIIGRIGSRLISVVINRETVGSYYVVSARDAAKKERRKVYEKERKREKIA